MDPRHPMVMWAQRKDRVFVSIQVEDVRDEKITVNERKLEFSCTGGSEKLPYHVSLEFHKDIMPEESKQKKGGREYFFDLKKKEEGPFWPRLLIDPVKPKYLKVDFNRWKDEDDSDVDEMPDANLEDMMKQMGGGGGMGMGMGDFDPANAPPMEDDSDDDDLPDLE